MNSLILYYKKFKFTMLIVLMLPLFWYGLKAGWNKANTDFPNYYVSAQLLIKGNLADAYDIEKFNKAIYAFNSEAEGLFVMYPPTTALLTIGLTPFDLLNAKRIWMLLSLIAAIALVFLINSLYNIDKTGAAIILLISGFSLYNDLMLGQVYTMMLAFIMLGWFSLVKNKNWLAGSSWGFVAAFKFLPLFFIPFLLFKKQYKITFILLLSFTLIHLITLLAGGLDAYESFIKVFTDNYLHGKVANQTALSIQYQSMEVFANLLSQVSNWSEWAVVLLKIIWKVFWLCLVILCCRKYHKSNYFLTISISAITLILLLFENGSASYHLLFCMLPLMAFFQIIEHRRIKVRLLIAYASMGFIPVLTSQLNIDNLFLNFSRLWCLSLFAAFFFAGLYKHSDFTK